MGLSSYSDAFIWKISWMVALCSASEFKLMQTTEDNAYNMKEIEELQEQQRTLKRQLFKTDCELQMLKMQQASEQE